MSNYQPPQAGAESLRHFPSGFFYRAQCVLTEQQLHDKGN